MCLLDVFVNGTRFVLTVVTVCISGCLPRFTVNIYLVITQRDGVQSYRTMEEAEKKKDMLLLNAHHGFLLMIMRGFQNEDGFTSKTTRKRVSVADP